MSTPRVLIVYANPAITATPVAPYGAERVAHALKIAGCEVRLAAPWLTFEPVAEIEALIRDFEPDLVGVSVRNVDDALVVRGTEGEGDIDTTFYLPEIRPMIEAVHASGTPILLGGAAMSSMGAGLLDYLGVDHGIVGAADDLVWRMGRALVGGADLDEALPDDPRVIRRGDGLIRRERGDADAWAPVPGPTPRMSEYLVLARERNGRIPVQLSAGCDRRCHFCVEASFQGHRVSPRPADHILAEVQLLVNAGIRRIWLTASELNVPSPAHAITVLKGIEEMGVEVDVTGFMQPAPVTDDFLDALEAVGVDPTTLSWEFGHLDDSMLRKGAGPVNRRSIDALVERYLKRGHPLLGASVLLGSHHAETDETIDGALAAAREIDEALPQGLGLAYATGGRVYPAAPLGQWVAENLEDARPHLYGTLSDGFIEPVVFCKPGSPRELLARVQDGLASCKGPMYPLNAEAAADPEVLRAEKQVSLAIVRADEEPEQSRRLLEAALGTCPDHTEALSQLAQVLANRLGEREAASDVLRRLRVQVAGDTLREAEIDRALAVLAR